MQYTIRQIPVDLDKAARARAKAEGKSLNQTVVESLRRDLGLPDQSQKRRDLSDLVGSMSDEDARIIEQSVAEHDRADIKSQRRGKR
jgi:hypothetical protein